MIQILALDLGKDTGWALSDTVGSIVSGTQTFNEGRFEGGGMRYLRFNRWLEDMHAICDGISEIYFEEVRRHLGTDAAHAYGGFLAHLTCWCENKAIPYQGIPVGTIKKYITGKGNAPKKDVIEALKNQGHFPKDHNEADALALIEYILSQR